MLRRLGIRGKVLATLSVPVLVLFILAGIVSNQAVQDVRTARATERLLDALDGANDMARVMQAERAATMAVVMGQPGAEEQMLQVRAMTDEALRLSAEAGAEVDLGGLDPIIERGLTGVQDQADQFAQLRAAVDSGRIAPRVAFAGYTTVIERVARFPAVVGTSLQDRRLGAIIQARTDTMILQEKYVQEQLFGSLVHAGLQTSTDASVFLALFPATDVAQETADLAVQGLDIADLEVPPLRTGLGTYGSLRSIAAASVQNFVGLGNPESWRLQSQDQIDSYEDVLEALGTRAYSRASQVADDATRTAAITIGLSALSVILSIVIAFVISRGIVIPLRRLTEAAGHVRDELPKLVEQVAVPGQGPDLSLARIPVRSHDEVGQLAVAFNQVNATTIEVAQEQAALRASIAEMFVNVARRDQVLLNRQLSFIDALERTEEDPATLADLFRLDHLATRMRRNAESLLVLAGIDTGRRLRDALPLSDVIRTASSEIEHYERIQLDLPIDPTMLGHTALPAAHLLAELLENATVFSDPGTPVQVSTGRQAEHMVVTVYDQGLGMTNAELRSANTKIKTTSASDVLGAERLGLFVVGRIASRLGATVTLASGPDGTGTLATVLFPVSLFAGAENVPVTAPQQHAPVIESFVTPDAVAESTHEHTFAPAPSGVQDVAPGSLGSAENPAQEVDLAALTAGTTGLGLPKRRSRDDAPEAELPARTSQGSYRDEDDAAAARSIPLAPRAEDLAGAAAFPARDDEAWTPPIVEAQPLNVRRRADEPAAEAPWTPDVAPGTPSAPARSSVLPTREPSATTGGISPVGLPTREPAAGAPFGGLPTRDTAGGLPSRTPSAPSPAPAFGAAAPANPQERASMFTGFRSRRAELAAAALGSDEPVDAPGVDGAERLAAAASGAAAFFGRGRDQHPADAPAQPAEGEQLIEVPTFADEPAYEQAPPAVEPEQPAWPRFAAAEPPTTTGSTSLVGEPLTRRARRGRHAYDPTEQQAPSWAPAQPAAQASEAPAWAPTEPVARREETFAVPSQADESPAEQTWVVPALEDDETQHAPSWEVPAPVAETAPQEEQAEPVWAAETSSAPVWQSEEPAEPSPWQAEQQATEVVPAVPAMPEPSTPVWQAEQPAAPAPDTGAWSAPQAPWAPMQSAAPAPAENEHASAKRKWWQRKKSETPSAPVTPAVPTAGPAAPVAPAAPPAPAAPQAPVAPVGFSPVGEAPATSAPFAPSPAEPTRTSAWGASQPGAHAGASAFFAPRDQGAPPAPVPAAPEPAAGWDVPSPHTPADTPIVTPPASPAPAAETAPGGWAPEPSGSPYDQWAGVKAPGSSPAAPPAQPAPVAPAPVATPRTTFTPQGSGFDDDVTNMLAQRADLAQQALAELSQLSSYRPQTVAGEAASLVRRTPGTIPAAPAIKTRSAERPTRDANQVRSLLSSFQSGTVRGREAADGAPQTADAGSPRFGAEADGSGPEPVGDPDLTQRSTTW